MIAIEAPGSAVPVNVGCLTLVMSSLDDAPLSLAATRSAADGAEGVADAGACWNPGEPASESIPSPSHGVMTALPTTASPIGCRFGYANVLRGVLGPLTLFHQLLAALMV